ncbi:prospero homeobox 3 [Aplochiton taeniatus]
MGFLGGRKRRSGVASEWSADVLRAKRLRLERLVGRRDREEEEEVEEEAQEEVEEEEEERKEGKERRREREELKGQLEQARERLQALQEKVWKVFGEKQKKRGGGGEEEEEEEGGQKFARALKAELGGAVARVIDRVLRLYADTADLPPPPPPSSPSPSASYPPPPPLPLPLLHYTMQQLFSRSLPRLPHLPPAHLHKDYLGVEPFLEFPHPQAFPPHPLLGHLESLLPPHHEREREGGMRGGGGGMEGGMRGGGGGMEGGELYLTSGWYHNQEGLSPCHLKKAKLLFFHTRYPSSNTLKTYFPDVKFNRCVTSQLIKWFSNFREFFYIQMERFARQAVRDAAAPRDGAPYPGRDPQLRLGRDTELYRILNMHYNKSNDYQVPEQFMEVAEIALREFYSAIQDGRDTDPCWKKSIYKIICKLDSSVPDAFRLPGCPVG